MKSLRSLAVLLLALILLGVMDHAPPATAQGGVPPVTNMELRNGPNSGEVIISWEAVPEATYYRIGYVNMVTDYPVANARGDWQEAFIYVDILNRGQSSYTIPRLEPGVRHAFSVLTNNSRHGEPTWPSNPTLVYLTVADPGQGPPQSTPPGSTGRPTGLTAFTGPEAGQVTLTWTPTAGAALHLVWSASPDGTGSQWHDADAGSAVISGLEAGLEYSFAVIAGYAASNGEISRWSGFSNPVRAVAQAAPAPEAAASAIAAGGKHTCMLQDAGAVVCWGANGDADKGQADPPADTTFTAITAGYEHSCGLTDAGSAVCWGNDENGQSTAPTDATFIHIDAGRAHTCALRADAGTAQCWGSNEYGQLDAPADASFTVITAGGGHSCGLRADGRMECWGDNHYQQASPPDSLFYAVSAGKWHTCGIKRDGSIACWGANSDGQAPAEVEGSYQAVSAGSKHTCAVVTEGGGSYCWGNGKSYSHWPWRGEFSASDSFTSVGAGDGHTCGVKTDNSIMCKGNNRYGQSAPLASDAYVSVSAGMHHTCGVRTDGSVVCWGENDYGMSTPTKI